jgi:hypothetical protein
MDQLILVALVTAGLGGILASISILRRERRQRERPFAVSTEGSVRCPTCGMGNLWNERTCSACGAPLPG